MPQTKCRSWLDLFIPAVVVLILLAAWMQHQSFRYLPLVDDMASFLLETGTYGAPLPHAVALRRDYDPYLEVTEYATFRRCLDACRHDVHPPAYFLILNLAMRWFGSSHLVGMLTSAVFGLGVVVIFYALLRQYGPPIPAGIAALCYGLSSGMFRLMLEVRHYTLMLAIYSLALFAVIRLVRQRDSRHGAWVLLGASQVASMWTHYINVVNLSILNIWLILCRAREGKKFWLPYSVTLATSVLVFSAWLPYVVDQVEVVRRVSQDNAVVAAEMSAAQLGQQCAYTFVRAFVCLPYRMQESGLQPAVAAAVLVLAACFAWRTDASELKLFFFLSAGALAIHYGLVVLKVYPPVFSATRHTLALAFNLWFVSLVGMLKVSHPRLRTLWLVILIAVSMGSVTVRYWQIGTNQIARRGEFIARASREADVVVVDAPELAPRYAYHAPGKATVIALSQKDILVRWRDLKEQISRSGHLVYVAELFEYREQHGTRQGMEAVLDKIRAAGLKLKTSQSEESATVHVFCFGQP